MDILPPLLLQLILILLNAFFACAEMAVVSTNEAKLNKLIAEGNKKAKTLQKLINSPSTFLSTIQIAITLSGFLGSAFAADNFAGLLIDVLSKTGIVNQGNEEIFNTISVVVITVILSMITLIFGELVPKRIGMRKSEKIALAVACPLNFISKLFTPIVWLLTISINGILKLIGIDPHSSDGDEGEENIRLMVDMSSEKGLIDKEEREMIQNVFEFDDLTVEEFAVHRTDVEFLWEEDSIETWEKTIKNSCYKHYPICGETTDDIVGVLNTKKYFRLDDKKDVRTAIEEAYFVPASLKADVLFKQFKCDKNKFAIVLDEHGGVEGIVTIDDILEQIVGDFNCEPYGIEATAKLIEDNVWEINGTFTIEEANDIFGTKFSTEGYETLSGFVFSQLGAIPSDGEQFEIEIENLKISVFEIKEHKIEKMTVTKIKKT